jgi:hypothetical protein
MKGRVPLLTLLMAAFMLTISAQARAIPTYVDFTGMDPTEETILTGFLANGVTPAEANLTTWAMTQGDWTIFGFQVSNPADGGVLPEIQILSVTIPTLLEAGGVDVDVFILGSATNADTGTAAWTPSSSIFSGGVDVSWFGIPAAGNVLLAGDVSGDPGGVGAAGFFEIGISNDLLYPGPYLLDVHVQDGSGGAGGQVPIPEPSTMLLLGSLATGLSAARRARARNRA